MEIFAISSLLSVLLSVYVSADECSQSCAYIATATSFGNRTCQQIGRQQSILVRIDWDDGSYSIVSDLNIDIKLVIGSCCSDFRHSDLRTGVVSEGRFEGENIIWVINSQSVRRTCDGCESNTGLSRAKRNSFFSIGTKGVGKWIECVGTGTVVYSPALTPTDGPVYTTGDFDFVCNDCVQSC